MWGEEPQGTQAGDSRAYRLLSTLGAGGFGSVYRGELQGASGFSKQVAIKLLNEEASKVEDFKARLRDEARLLALLRHRAIVHVEDLVKLHGRWAVVMEYVEGADLKELMALGPMSPRPVCEIAGEAASALQVAHEAKDPRTGAHLSIVHRDIKPANIRITPSGEVKVLDFGVARAAFDDREAMTRSMAFGSLGYIAPERFDGNDMPAADVYALGVVVLEALSGKPIGQLSVNPKKHDEKVKDRLEQLLESVGGGFGGQAVLFLARMMAYDFEERPTAAEVVERFQGLFIEAPGPWLKSWIPGALQQVEHEESTVDSGGVKRVIDSQANPGLTVSGVPEPHSGDSIERVGAVEAASEPMDLADRQEGEPEPPDPGSTRAVISGALRDSGGVPLQEEQAGVGLTAVLESLASQERIPGQGVADVPERGVQADLRADQAEASSGQAATRAERKDEQVEREPEADDVLLPQPVVRSRRFGLLLLLLLVPAAAALGAAVVAWVVWPTGDDQPGEASEQVSERPEGQALEDGTADGAQRSPEPEPAQVAEARDAPAPPPPAEEVRTKPPAAPTGFTDAPESSSASAAMGTVEVLGSILGARLKGADGKTYSPGEVPTGTYDLAVAFPGGAKVKLPGYVKVQAGQTTTVRCDKVAQQCR